MQAILGSGGAIGVELAKALPNYTDAIRLVSRKPSKVNEDDHLMAADLTNRDDVLNAVEGTDIVYLTVGLPYQVKIWESTWPRVVDNVIEACRLHGSKLVFFDNVYMYHPSQIGAMTEDSLIEPVSRKGKVRARIAGKIMHAAKQGDITALIARSADIYGPSIKQVSLLTETVFKPLSQGKKAQCLGNTNAKHSFTYTPDAGKATALLGNSDFAFGQVWHLPTAEDPPKLKEFVEIIATELGVQPKYQSANKLMIRILGLFNPIMKEFVEMMYQYDRDYIFKSDKFNQRFELTPTPYLQGIRDIIKADYS